MPSHVAIVRNDPDAARFENIEGVIDLAQAAVYIREWDDGKQTEPPRVIASKVGRVIIAEPGRTTGGVRVAEPDAG